MLRDGAAELPCRFFVRETGPLRGDVKRALKSTHTGNWSILYRHEVIIVKMAENISVAGFAFLGGVLRCVLSQHLAAAGTLVVNLAGCFLLALVTCWFTRHSGWPGWLTSGLGTGMIGALTTFSTFSFETVSFLQSGAVAAGLLYWAANSAGGLLCAAMGYEMGCRL